MEIGKWMLQMVSIVILSNNKETVVREGNRNNEKGRLI